MCQIAFLSVSCSSVLIYSCAKFLFALKMRIPCQHQNDQNGVHKFGRELHFLSPRGFRGMKLWSGFFAQEPYWYAYLVQQKIRQVGRWGSPIMSNNFGRSLKMGWEKERERMAEHIKAAKKSNLGGGSFLGSML